MFVDIVDDETVEILPEDFVINPDPPPEILNSESPPEILNSESPPEIIGSEPPPGIPDKGNRASPVRFGSANCPPPPNFPTDLTLTLENYQNWSEDLLVADVWMCQVRTAKEVVKLANWAYIYGYKIRAKGSSQSWAPLTVTRNSKCSNTILVDTTAHLNQMRMVASKTNSELRAVYVQTGTTLENLLAYLQSNKASLYAAPVSGESTVGMSKFF